MYPLGDDFMVNFTMPLVVFICCILTQESNALLQVVLLFLSLIAEMSYTTLYSFILQGLQSYKLLKLELLDESVASRH